MKWNITFPDNTRKIIFQCNFFGKTICSDHLEKIWFFCAVSCKSSAIDAVLRVLLIIELLSDLGKLFQETNPLGELISDSDVYVKDIWVPRETIITHEIFETNSSFYVK